MERDYLFWWSITSGEEKGVSLGARLFSETCKRRLKSGY